MLKRPLNRPRVLIVSSKPADMVFLNRHGVCGYSLYKHVSCLLTSYKQQHFPKRNGNDRQ